MKATRKSSSKVILSKLDTLENLLKKKDDRPLNFKEACAYLGFAPSYLYKLTYRKVIPHYKPTGKVLFFSKCELDEWIFAKSKIKIQKSKDEKIIEENEEDEEAEADPSTMLRVTNKGNGTRMTLIERISAD
jgi:excisionase family DNA binding protein